MIWSLYQVEHLPSDLCEALSRPENDVCFSAASIFEIAIKTAPRRFDFNFRPDDIAAATRETSFAELPVSASQASQIAHLPPVSCCAVPPKSGVGTSALLRRAATTSPG
ncbi:hypothetical protein [Candidatus Accumulibacter sp. ACC003]|uniref:hypothetical protein n=1 Tax=Candidatus Accumulibacter sp. ACC003 TaxID=2823334 RepID=UPI0025C4CC2B|nr:hypothetical protein [Candidatus Accumulibacter sp. ACC003]